MAEMDEILQTFLSFDRDGNGFIDREEFSELVKVAGASLEPEKVDKAFQAVDIDGNGVIDFNEFIRWWYERMEGKKSAAKKEEGEQSNSISFARIEPVKAENRGAQNQLEEEITSLQEKLRVASQCEAATKAELFAIRSELKKALETVESQRSAIGRLEAELEDAQAAKGESSPANTEALIANQKRLAKENRELRREFEKFTERLAKLRDNAIDALFRCGTEE